jgi:heat-inducible transcriptional repressor
MVAGTANLARYSQEFDDIEPLLSALEEHVVLLRLLGEAASPSATVRIGYENATSGLSATSIVAAGYGPDGRPLASLGVVGPTRMDYPGTMAAVGAVARYVSQILAAR